MEAQISRADERQPVRLRDLFYPLLAVLLAEAVLFVGYAAIAWSINHRFTFVTILLIRASAVKNVNLLLAGMCLLYAVMIAALWAVCRKRGQATITGYFAKPSFAQIGGGALCGFLYFAVVPIVLGIFRYSNVVAFHPTTSERVLASGHSPLSLVFTLLVAAVMAPVAEEIYFRGLLLSYLRRWFWIPFAVAIDGGLFALIHFRFVTHVGLEGWIITAVVAILGAVNAILYLRTRSLWAPVMAHAVYNSSLIITVWVVHAVTTTTHAI